MPPICFDLDGVLIHTMPWHATAWQEAARRFGCRVSRREIYLWEGEPGLVTATRLLRRTRSSSRPKPSPQELLLEKERRFKRLARAVQVQPLLRTLIVQLARRHVRLALVTGTSSRELPRILSSAFLKRFQVIVTGDRVRHGKPHPEPYRRAMRALRARSSQTIVVENAPNGIRSAQRAGCGLVIALASSLPKRHLAQADVIVSTAAQLRALLQRKLLVVLLAALFIPFQSSGWSGEVERARQVDSIVVSPPKRHPVIGERLNFHGRWFGIPVGHGSLEVKGIVTLEGRQAIHIVAQGRTNDVLSKLYPIQDEIHSYLDAQTLKPLRFEKRQREGRYRSDEVVTFDHATHKATYQSLLNGSTKEIELPEDFHDLISALYWFRSQPLQPNQTISAKLYTDEKIYETKIEIKAPALLELLKRGTFPCLVVEPQASFKGLLVKRGRIWAYLTADEHRVPLLVKATTPWGAMSAVIEQESLDSVLAQAQTPSKQTP